MEKEKAKSKLQKMQEQLAAEDNHVEVPKPTKWYMGDYANNDGAFCLFVCLFVCLLGFLHRF